jgi:hypothetical protein
MKIGINGYITEKISEIKNLINYMKIYNQDCTYIHTTE